MKISKNLIPKTNIEIPRFAVGTWAFGDDGMWGHQKLSLSQEVLAKALDLGLNLIDTAPIYGKGVSEKVIGDFLKKTNQRDKAIIATKLGLSWDGSEISHDLSKAKMLKELDESLKRLSTDYIDIYQIHWPDPDTDIKEVAQTMQEFLDKGKIKAVGVSNFTVSQIKQFMTNCPISVLQPPYNMFTREIEKEILPFCVKENIHTFIYGALEGGILTGKFNLEGKAKPKDWARTAFYPDLKEPNFTINTDIFIGFKNIADKYNWSVSELVLNWTLLQRGVSTLLVGCRNLAQLESNIRVFDRAIDEKDLDKIEELLTLRKERLGRG